MTGPSFCGATHHVGHRLPPSMAPFYKAIDISHAPNLSSEEIGVYTGHVDPECAVGAVPNGGYVLALILEACIQHQAQASEHTDPIHITAHYLRPSSVSHFEVHIRTVKVGNRFTNLSADFMQKGLAKVTSHAIFGCNRPTTGATAHSGLTLSAPSPFARRIPLYTHPATATPTSLRHTWKFHKQVRWAEDPIIRSKNQIENRVLENAKRPAPESNPSGNNESSRTFVGGDGLEWGAWFEFVDENERLTNPHLAFLADIFLNVPTLLPKSERPGLTTSWFPTVMISVEFKWPIPPASPLRSKRTVGLYSNGKFLTHPQGRHDAYVEVWTAPCDIGQVGAAGGEGWRDKQVCLATATQMALTVPMEVNEAKGKRHSEGEGARKAPKNLDKAKL